MQLFRFENVACNFFVCLGLLALLDVSRNRETWRRVWRVCMCGGARGRGRGGERWALQRKDRGREKWSWHSWVQGQRAIGCVARGVRRHAFPRRGSNPRKRVATPFRLPEALVQIHALGSSGSNALHLIEGVQAIVQTVIVLGFPNNWRMLRFPCLVWLRSAPVVV